MAQVRNDQGVRSVQLALDILEAVAFSGDEIGVTQIASRVGLTKGSVFRHLQTLVERGYLAQNHATARYVLGPKGHLIGSMAPSNTDVAAVAERPMRELRDALGFSAVLSTPSTKGALVVKTVPGTTSIEIGVRPGSELAFHASAQGKIFLAFGREPLLQRVLRQGLTQLTAHTRTSHDDLIAEIERIRAQGYAVAPEEVLLGINTLAAPVFDHRDCVAAVAVVSSIQYVPSEPAAEVIDAVKRTADAISRDLGYVEAAWPNAGSPRRARRTASVRERVVQR